MTALPTSARTNRRSCQFPIAAACALAAALTGCKSYSTSDIPEPETNQERVAAIARAESLSRDAQRREVSGKPEQAVDLYKAAIAEYREMPVAWLNLGVLMQKQGRNLDAAECYKTASELSPTDPRPLYNLGSLWEGLGYLDDAARWYDEALQRDPNFLPALRRSVLVDDQRSKLSQTTAERLKAAILMEREPAWINRFKRIQQRMNERPLGPTADDARPPSSVSAPLAPD